MNRGGYRPRARRGERVMRWWKSQKPVWQIVALDILAIGLSLLVFAYFHHVRSYEEAGTGRVSSRGGASAVTRTSSVPVEETSAESLPEEAAPEEEFTEEEFSEEEFSEDALAEEEFPEEGFSEEEFSEDGLADGETADAEGTEPVSDPVAALALEDEPMEAATDDPVGYFGTKFASMFLDSPTDTPIKEGLSYKSYNVNVTLNVAEAFNSQVYIVDIYVRDISSMRTALAKDKYGKGISEKTVKMAKRVGAIAAINGDYYGARSDGVVIRNGVLYRNDKATSRDVCVLYWDGTMRTYSPREFNVDEAMEQGAYQTWNFGPKLLDSEGKRMTKFNSDVTGGNPRSAIGYYEPGHYCLVAVDGRSEKSKGVTMKNLSVIMETLGCKAAYNLDGGQTSVMACMGKVVNNPYKGGRNCSDIICVVDEVFQD